MTDVNGATIDIGEVVYIPARRVLATTSGNDVAVEPLHTSGVTLVLPGDKTIVGPGLGFPASLET